MRATPSAVVLAAAALLVGGLAAPAQADDLGTSSADFTLSAASKTLNVEVGRSKPVTLHLLPTDDDDRPGCNLKPASSSTVTFDVVTSGTATFSGLPSTVTMPADCVSTALTVTPATAGTATIGFTYRSSSNAHNRIDAEDFAVEAATFSVNATVADGTPPSIGYTLDPAAATGDNDWYTGDVAVAWTVTDAESTPTPSGCVDSTLATDGTRTYTCAASSAGGSAQPVSVTLRRDSTPPAVTPVVTGVTDAAGAWYTGDVEVAWDVSDATSGVASGCAPVTLAEDTDGRTFTCVATDRAGNRSVESVSVKRDATAPVVSRTVSGTPGENGWWTSDVAIDWAVDEPTSGPASVEGCRDTTVGDADGEVTSTCSATNAAGLTTEGEPVTVRVDSIAPVVSGSASGPEGSAGWFTGDVDVAWSYTEDGSGVSEECAPGAQTTDTRGRDFECTVTDRAGNVSNTAVVGVTRDATAPTITPDVTGRAGDDGWYTSDVDVAFVRGDDVSGVAVAVGCDPAPLTEDTAGTTYSCTVTDVAGNTTTREVTVKRDATAPVIGHTLTGTEGQGGWFTSNVDLAWQVSDALSGDGSRSGCAPTTVTEDTDASGAAYTCTARDAAGNEQSQTATVLKDGTAPTVAPVVEGELGDNAWYVGDVSVRWDTTDLSSGVGLREDCVDATLTEDTTGQDFSCTATDVAGNVTSVTTSVKRDASAPVITRTVSGTPGQNGWYTSDVEIDWTVAEDVSNPVTLTGCEDVTVSDADGEVTSTCAAENDAGLTSEAGPATVRVDSIAPVVSGSTDGPEGDNGWFVGDVVVSWSHVESGSGVVEECAPEEQTTDTTGTDFTCTVQDAAGNTSAPATVTVTRDATAPTVTAEVIGRAGDNGWYTGDVEVEFTHDDATSGVAEVAGCDPAPVTEDTAEAAFSCTVTDAAGNEQTEPVTLKRDATEPDLTPELSDPAGPAGWFTDDVTLTWVVTDALSGVVSSEGCDPVTLSEDTGPDGEDFLCSATDEAGNDRSRTVTVKRDGTAPVVAASVTGDRGENGWYVGPVDVSWSVVDASSGVDPDSVTGCASATVGDDTGSAGFTCSASDVAGNPASSSVTVRKDATAPTLTWSAPADGATYDFGDTLPAASCTAEDVTSGVDDEGCTVGVGTPDTAPTGTYLLTATATDNAGNTTTETRSYTVRAWTLAGFHKPVNMGSTVVNTVKAGSTVPLKFEVFRGAEGARTELTSDIGATFSARRASCNGGAIADAIEEFATTGATALRYDATAGQWIQNWATPSSGKGSCYRVTMTTADGSTIAASFQLR